MKWWCRLKTMFLNPQSESFQLFYMASRIEQFCSFWLKTGLLLCFPRPGLFSPHLISQLPLLIQGFHSSFSPAPTMVAAHPPWCLPPLSYIPAFQTPLLTCSSVSLTLTYGTKMEGWEKEKPVMFSRQVTPGTWYSHPGTPICSHSGVLT